jgi:Domain of unknown function (DUF4157)
VPARFPHWQRTIDQPVHVPQQHAKPDARAGRSSIDQVTHFGFDFSQIPIHPQPPANIQAKLAASSPGDACEREADRVSERVMRIPEPQLQHDGMSGESYAKCQTAQPGNEHVRVQTKRVGASESGQIAAPSIVHEAVRSPGQSLNATTRAFMASRFGNDFSQVRVHTDGEAADAARAVRARAYTIGRDIVFGAGQYAPATRDGKQLLAHELTHVMQQQALAAPYILCRKPDDGKKASEDEKQSKDKEQSKDKKESKEDKEREKLLADSTDGATLTPKQVARIAAAMRAFSLHQLHAMRSAGLRFWQGDSLPPEFQGRVVVANISTPAEYLDIIHVIRMAENATTDAIRHEIAHAWDHVRTGKVKPVGQLNDKALVKAVENTPVLSSASKEKRATKETQGGKVRGVRLSISEMLDRYKKSAPLRENNFDNPSTRESYSKSSPREFYAEGYSVFHSGREWNQARLLYYAPELYELLEAEAKQEGLPVPDRSKIEAAVKEQGLPL